MLGTPEGELALAEACVYLATAPKSNALYTAFGAAMRAAKEGGSLLPPKHILNAPTKLMKARGLRLAATNTTTTRRRPFPARTIFPEELPRQEFYQPTERGYEKAHRRAHGGVGAAAGASGAR